MASIEKGSIIGEFDLYDYGLPTTKGYLLHQISNGGNSGTKYPENREGSAATSAGVDQGCIRIRSDV